MTSAGASACTPARTSSSSSIGEWTVSAGSVPSYTASLLGGSGRGWQGDEQRGGRQGGGIGEDAGAVGARQLGGGHVVVVGELGEHRLDVVGDRREDGERALAAAVLVEIGGEQPEQAAHL